MKNEREPAVVAIGEVVVDWLSADNGKGFMDSHHWLRSLGGNASNVAIGLTRLGTSARLVGKLGDDLHGKYLKDVLALEKVDSGCLLTTADYPTAQCYVMTDEHGEHSFYNWPRPHAAQMLSPDDIGLHCLQGAQILHATGISFTLNPRKSAVEKAIKLAEDNEMMISFDAGFPPGESLEVTRAAEWALARAHLIKFNSRELHFWSQADPALGVRKIARQLFDRLGALVILVTLGSGGSLIVTDRFIVETPAFRVEVVDPVGAGDGFVAGFIHCLLEKLEGGHLLSSIALLKESQWQEIGLFANAVAALATTTKSAYQGMPDLQKVGRTMAHRQRIS